MFKIRNIQIIETFNKLARLIHSSCNLTQGDAEVNEK